MSTTETLWIELQNAKPGLINNIDLQYHTKSNTNCITTHMQRISDIAPAMIDQEHRLNKALRCQTDSPNMPNSFRLLT